MRRLVILLLLLVGLRLILPLGATGRGSQWLLTLGFLILAAYSVGEIARGFGLPKIVGYLVAGLVFGPAVLNTVNTEAVQALAPVGSLAIALIAYLAGAELRWTDLRESWRAILKITAAELALTLVLVTTVVALLGDRVPFLAGQGPWSVLALSLLFSSIAIIHSPAATMALLSETGARGPIARTTLGIVLIADVIVVILFSGAFALARTLAPSPVPDVEGPSLGLVTWELGGAVLVGAVFGGVVALYLRFIQRELFLFAVMTAFAGAVIARLINVEPLLMLVTAGFVSENLSRPSDGEALRHAMERSADPVFVVFFALAGAAIQVDAVTASIVVVIPIVLVRALGIWGGTRLGARWAGVREQGPLVWMGLVSQAGVAIGLAAVAAQAYPVRGGMIQSVMLAIIAINQIVGPILFRRALVRSGEVATTREHPVVRTPSPV